jgi:uncharacterized protein YcfJ
MQATTTTPAATATHPLMLVAAASVTVLSLAGVAAIANSQSWFGGKAADTVEKPATVAQAPAAAVTPAPISVQQTVNLPAAKTETRPASKVGVASSGHFRPDGLPAGGTAHSVAAPRTVSYRPTTTAYEEPVTVASSMPSVYAPPAICRDCGVIDRIDEIPVEGKAGAGGAIIGGVVGSIIGNQIGNGHQRDVARILGMAGGAYAGNQIEKSNNKSVRYEMVVRFEDGTTRRIDSATPPSWRVGDRVRLQNGAIYSRS